MVPSDERLKQTKNPRIHGVKHTFPTILGGMGYTKYGIQEVTGHIHVRDAANYSKKAHKRQLSMRSSAISYTRSLVCKAQKTSQSSKPSSSKDKPE